MPGNGQSLQDGGCLMDMLPVNHLHISDGERGRYPWRSGAQRPVPVPAVVPSTTPIPPLSVNIELRIWCFLVFEGLEINIEHGCVPPSRPRVVSQISGLCANLPGL